MAFTAGGIEYEELEGSPTFGVRFDSMEAQQIVKIAWTDIDALLLELFPDVVVSGCDFVFSPVAKFPGRSYLHVDQVQVEPFDPGCPIGYDGNGVGMYKHAKLTVKYKTDERTEDSAEILTHRVGISGEFITLPASGLRWASQSAGETVPHEDICAGKVIPTIEHRLTFNFVPSPNFAGIVAQCGKVNPSSGGLFNSSAETLMFLGVDAERKITARGAESWRLDYRFTERVVKQGGLSVGWNHFFRPETGIWERLLDRNGNRIYDLGNFDVLFSGADCE